MSKQEGGSIWQSFATMCACNVSIPYQEEVMLDKHDDSSSPDFVFVCGAVGSGNTFMFKCLTKDSSTYGINEDGFGLTLRRLITSERDMEVCPHSISMFREFLYALRADRGTLILKTPANVRHHEILRKHLGNCKFILMIREPHAAIVSGLSRHGKDVESVARYWLRDNQYLVELGDDAFVITFDDLVRNPVNILEHVAEHIIPLSPGVFKYATRVHHAKRATSSWWQNKVDEQVRKDVEYWVKELQLEEFYRSAQTLGQGTHPSLGMDTQNLTLLTPLDSARRFFFKAWYRFMR
jgi:hypothetical protein